MHFVQLARVAVFNEQIRIFLKALDGITEFWVYQKGEEGYVSSEELCEYYRVAFNAKDRVNELSSSVVTLITPPAGLPGTQFLTQILDDIENAWHPCRFLHVMKSDVASRDPDLELVRVNMLTRTHILRNNLWEAWRHISHFIELEQAAKKGPPKVSKAAQTDASSPGMPLSKIQIEILESLDKRALTRNQLALEIDRAESATSDHLRGLMETGLIKNNRKVGGYYRPDSPPINLD